MSAAEEKIARDVEESGMLDAELRDTKLKLELMADWKKLVMNADEKAVDAVSEVAEVKCGLSKFAEKRNEFEGGLREVDVESGGRAVPFNIFLVR